MKTTLIAWYDHRGRYGWHDEPSDMLDIARGLFFSVGFVVAEDDHSVVISATVEDDKTTYDDTTAILKSAIYKRADIDLVADEGEEDEDPYLVVPDDETSFADIYDPPDAPSVTTTEVQPPPDTPACGGPIG